MPALKNPRQERFARLIAKGDLPQYQCLRRSGYKGATDNSAWSAASRLSSNVKVESRVAELKERYAKMAGITREGQTAKLERIRELAEADKQYSAANAAVKEQNEINHLKTTDININRDRDNASKDDILLALMAKLDEAAALMSIDPDQDTEH